MVLVLFNRRLWGVLRGEDKFHFKAAEAEVSMGHPGKEKGAQGQSAHGSNTRVPPIQNV